MGKAKIQSHQGDGLYFVSYYRDVEYAQSELDRLTKQRDELESAIYKPGGLNDQLLDSSNIIGQKEVEFNDAMAAWKECAASLPPCPNEKQLLQDVLAAGKAKQAAIVVHMTTQAKIATNKADMLSALRRMAFFQNYGTDKESEGMVAWCVDYPHEDTGPIANGTMVGTIETYGGKSIAGQNFQGPNEMINIQVSYGGNAPYNAGRDHQIQPVAAESVATALVNSIEWLGVMAKRPLYEMGTLQSKDEQSNTGTVLIAGNTLVSGAPTVEGVFPKTLEYVPIVYQTCHAKVFEPGDKVIVKYAQGERGVPTVIGFASNPRECKWFTFTYNCEQGLYLVGDTSQFVLKERDGTEVAVMPLTDTWTFIRWNDNKGDNPRTDLNAQANISVIAKSMPTPIWPDSISMACQLDAGPTGAGVCCFGGTSTTNGNSYTKTFIGNEYQLPESLDVWAAVQDFWVGVFVSSSGGNPGTGEFVFPTHTVEEGGIIGFKTLPREAGELAWVAPDYLLHTDGYVGCADSYVVQGGVAGIVNCDVVLGAQTQNFYAVGSCSYDELGPWLNSFASHMQNTPPPTKVEWVGTYDGMSVRIARWYNYSHVDTTAGTYVFEKGGQVTP